MPDYGVTPQGFVPKRLDVILSEMTESISSDLGISVGIDKQSYLNVLLTDIADKIAELWEVAQDVYASAYPSMAEGTSLDNVGQLGGVTRELAERSFYPIHCTGAEGTAVPAGTVIASNTNPAVNFDCSETSTLLRSSCNKAVIKTAAIQANTAYSVALNTQVYTFTSGASPSASDVITGLSAAITSEDFTCTINSDGDLLIEAKDLQSNNAVVLSSNLTTENVTCILTFASEEYGDISLPAGTITSIVTAVSGLSAVYNYGDYTPGQLRETDTEFRKSYTDKIFNMSSYMLTSIKAAILQNVAGVSSVAGYENDTNTTDAMGRPPHSIEFVVDGGSSTLIAQQIIKKKAAGISTYGSTEVNVQGEQGEAITIRFNRPQYVYVWFKVTVTMSSKESLPANYADLIKASITTQMAAITAGQNVVVQKFVADMYSNISGIDYVDILACHSTSSSYTPASSDYTERVVDISIRQTAITDTAKIGVGLNE